MAEIDDSDDSEDYFGPAEGEEIVEKLQMAGRATKNWGKASDFAKNLRFLAALKGLNAGSLAKKVQSMLISTGKELSGEEYPPELMKQNMEEIKKNPVDPRWVRRLMKKGIAKPQKRTFKHLHALALYFAVSPEELWNPQLATIVSLPHNFDSAAYDGELIVTDFETLQMRKLSALLACEKYQYLKSLIDSLFDEMTKAKKLKEKKAKVVRK